MADIASLILLLAADICFYKRNPGYFSYLLIRVNYNIGIITNMNITLIMIIILQPQ
jgi:hypothetical protein